MMKTKLISILCFMLLVQVAKAQLNVVILYHGDTVYALPMCTDSCYQFTASVSGGVPPYTYIWNNQATTDTTTYCTADMPTYEDSVKVEVISSNFLHAYFFIWSPNYLNFNQEICLVTVDSVTHKNMIIWEQNTDPMVESYNIYKETTTFNQFQHIGTVSRNDVSVFVDTTSHPEQVSAKYKMTATNGCLETFLSLSHKTMHLTINQGMNTAWNLIWENYQGNNYAIKYRIWRSTAANGLQLIDSVSSSVTTYTDLNPPAGILYYALEMIPNHACNPTAKNNTYTSSFSNVADNSSYLGINKENVSASNILIMPNPVIDMFELNFNYFSNENTLEIFDVRGVKVYNVQNIKNQEAIDFSKQTKGVYFFTFKTEHKIFKGKFIKL